MAGMAITAVFPLDTYFGHAPDGSPEIVPEPLRLYSALVQAAALGCLSTGNSHDPYSQAARKALKWLEMNPPVALRIPRHIRLSDRQDLITYRVEGVFHKENKVVKYKKTGRRTSDGTCFSGPIQWIWDQLPSKDILNTLDDLCADVSHLGETSSPVCLSVTKAQEPTHRLDPDAGFFRERGELRQDLASPGRLEELEKDYSSFNSGKVPTIARDNHNTTTLPHSPIPTRNRVATGVYRSVVATDADVPWTQVLAIPVQDESVVIPDEDLVSVCVALHRAIVSKLGQAAPPEITGHYPPGETPPANRVAIHLVPGDTPGLPFSDNRDRFLLLVPRGMSGEAFGELARSLTTISRVVNAKYLLKLASNETEVFAGEAFWRFPEKGTRRIWEAVPGFVPERRTKPSGNKSSIEIAGAWSIGNVMRDLVEDIATKSPIERYTVAAEFGVRIYGRALRTQRPRGYVHRTNHRNPVQPYRLTVDLGALVPVQAVMALGQSRHLGCGLLLPIDIPVDTKEQQ